MQWGTSEFENSELERAAFKGLMIKSHIDGGPSEYFPPLLRYRRMCCTFMMIAAMILLVAGVVVAIYIMKFQIQEQGQSPDTASYLASICNAVQIQFFNSFYVYYAQYLTTLENQRTDTDFQDSMIIKIFLFQFINSYASFFFLAFIAEYLASPKNTSPDFVGQCGAKNCMEPLSINLVIIFGSRLVLTNLSDYVYTL